MRYYEYINQFPFCEYLDKRPGFDKHHVVPRAVQIERYGDIISDLCVVLTRSQHIRAHYLYCLEYPDSTSQLFALRLLAGNDCSYLTSSEIENLCKLAESRPIIISESTKQKRSQALKKYYKEHPEAHTMREGERNVSKRPEVRVKISENNAMRNPVSREKVSKALKGRSISEAQRKHLSEVMKGKPSHMKGKHHSEEAKWKISEANKGKHHSDGWKKKMSETMKGENNPNYGKHFSEETKKKMSLIRKGKKYYNNGVVNRLFKPGDEPEDFIPGRIYKRSES